MQPIEGYETTEVRGMNDRVYFLHDGVQGYVMPRKEAPRELEKGENLRVFTYRNKEGALTATVKEPWAAVGDFAVLPVLRTTRAGVFLDRGLGYDLFAPAARVRGSFQPGDRAVVRLVPDKMGYGVVATTEFKAYFDRDVSDLEEGQRVDLIIFSQSDLGYGVIMDNRWEGLIYRNEVYEELALGDQREGFIKKIREDGRVDVSLQPQDFKEAAEEAKTRILRELRKADGFLPLGDHSAPREVMERFGLSKKRFKAAAGMLQKDGVLEIRPEGLRLKGGQEVEVDVEVKGP